MFGTSLGWVIALEGIATGPRNQQELAAILHVKTQTLGKVLARLQARGLLTRTRHPSDRRQLMIELTGAGEAALAAARRAEIEAFPADMDVQDWRILQEELANSGTRRGLPRERGGGAPGCR
jgi:MarR family transcriptional regulator, organic hydroperoxide resistance regulator